jgi:glyoxylate reductase
MARVLVTRQLPEGSLGALEEGGHEIVQRPDDTPWSARELAQVAPRVDAMVCLLTDRIDRHLLEAGAAGSLQVVANVAVGYDNIDVVAAHQLGVAVCNTPGVLDQTTADLAFLLVLAALRRTSDAEADLRAGRWEGWGLSDHLGLDVHEAVLGLVGYGRIGREVGRRATGFGMEVLHHTSRFTGLPGYVGSLHELLSLCDAVSLHVPLTERTRHLIGPEELSLLGPSGVLVNTSRGAVVDEEALAEALEDGTIFGAGLDVYEGEPTVNRRLLAAPHLVLLPHIGSATVQTRTKMAALAVRGACDVLAGRQPPNLVTA